jgi:RimJ/RimL family protein N-acetyltransferase
MMQRLIACARDAGYLRISGTVLSENHDMHRLMTRLGFKAERGRDDPTVIEFSQALA